MEKDLVQEKINELKKKEDEKEADKKPEEPVKDSSEGDRPEVYKPIDDANIAAKRLEDANKEKRELLDREEVLEAKKRLGGTAEAGGKSVKETDDEKWAKDAKERYAGTGLDPTPDDTPTTFT